MYTDYMYLCVWNEPQEPKCLPISSKKFNGFLCWLNVAMLKVSNKLKHKKNHHELINWPLLVKIEL